MVSMVPAPTPVPTGRPRWIGVGHSAAADSRAAGVEAVRAALRGLDTRLLIAFVSPSHDLQALLDGIREHCPDTPLIGCSTSGEIATDGPGDAGVVVTALGGEGFTVATTAATHASRDLREAGAQAAACVERVSAGRHQVLLLLSAPVETLVPEVG